MFERFHRLPLTEIGLIEGIPADQLRHTRVAQDLLDRGRLEGRQGGEAQGEADVTLRQLNRRCGPLSEAATSDLAAWLPEHAG